MMMIDQIATLPPPIGGCFGIGIGDILNKTNYFYGQHPQAIDPKEANNGSF
jgi:hypothetical protein